jgi:uncharacterized membrane protein
LLSLALIIVAHLLPADLPRIILGVPFVIFIPGYALLVAIFPRNWGLSGTERVAFSFILSIAAVGLLALILNYTPLGINLESVLYSVVAFILITSIIAVLRQRRLNKLERFTVRFSLSMPSWGESAWDRVITIALVIVITGGLGWFGYTIVTPKFGETFTEFYILGPEGKAENYPKELSIGDEATIIVGIINHEGEETEYRVDVLVDNNKIADIGPIVLVNEERWEDNIFLVPEVAGENQKVEFLIYIDTEVEPHVDPLHFWVDVK